MKKKIRLWVGLTLICTPLMAQVAIYSSGGPLMPEQAAYDVTFYDLAVQIFPNTERIDGRVTVRANVVQPMNYLVLDLDTLLQVTSAIEITPQGKPIPRMVTREVGKIWIALGNTRQHGEKINVQVNYGGKPRVAPRPPWDCGITWAKTPSGAPWISSTCQTSGADVWWPVKDHVSDEPDSMAIHIRVPENLVAACNGKLKRTENHGDGTRSFHWYVSTPINTYCVALNIAPYKVIEGKHKSVAGDVFPVFFYVLPEDYEKGQKLFSEIQDHISFYEKYLGPYPFRADKYGVAETSHLGMEHQSIIAYGAKFNNGSMTGGKDWGFDALHHHEFGHEWWGNLVTNADWKDMWIHEGICTYMQALYVEDLKGINGYHDFMNNSRRFGNTLAIAPKKTTASVDIYKAPIYNKGAWALHVLRYLMGKDALLRSLRRMCYPDAATEKITDGRQCRFVTTDDFRLICEKESGMSLEWFFDVYLRQPALPKLISKIDQNEITLRWDTPSQLPFPMPVDVKINGKIQRVDVTAAGVTLKFAAGDKPEIDPEKWVLFDFAKP